MRCSLSLGGGQISRPIVMAQRHGGLCTETRKQRGDSPYILEMG